eukprot:3206590-Amphidinium_carterae.2
MFNVCRRVQKESAGNSLTRTAAYYHAGDPSFLSDYDRVVPPVSTSVRQKSAQLPEWDADARTTECSIEEPFLSDLMAAPTWNTLTPQTLKMCGLQWQVLSSSGSSWEKVKGSWQNLLLKRGMLISGHEAGNTGMVLVLGACLYGFVGWRVTGNRDTKRLKIQSELNRGLIYDGITDASLWHEARVSCSRIEVEGKRGMQLTRGHSRTLLRSSALRGFDTLSTKQLQQVADDLKVENRPASRTASEIDIATCVIRHALGEECTDALLKSALACRKLEDPAEQHLDIAVVVGNAPEDPDEDTDEEGYLDDEVILAWNARRLEKAALKQNAEQDPALYERHWKEAQNAGRILVHTSGDHSGSAASSSSTSAPVRKFNPVPCRSFTSKEAKQYLPPQGFALHKDMKENRWRLVTDYLVDSQKSKSYGKGSIGDDHSALLFVLRNAWRAYYRVHRTECPWDLDALSVQASAVTTDGKGRKALNPLPCNSFFEK